MDTAKLLFYVTLPIPLISCLLVKNIPWENISEGMPVNVLYHFYKIVLYNDN